MSMTLALDFQMRLETRDVTWHAHAQGLKALYLSVYPSIHPSIHPSIYLSS